MPEKFILCQSFGEDLWKEQVSFQHRSAIHISEASFNSSCVVGCSFGSNVIHLRMNAAMPAMSNCKLLYKSSKNITPEGPCQITHRTQSYARPEIRMERP